MKSIFTPWSSRKPQETKSLEDEDSEKSDNSEKTTPIRTTLYPPVRDLNDPNIFTFPAPEIPRLDEIPESNKPKATTAQEVFEEIPKPENPEELGSPYRMLAEFFRKKGPEPLTEIETAGVMTILSQFQQQNDGSPSSSSIKSPMNQITSIHTPSLNRFESYPNTSNMFTPKNSKRMKLLPQASSTTTTPQRNSTTQTPTLGSSPRYTPMYSGSKKRFSESSAFKPRKIANLASIPTPYRPTTDSQIFKVRDIEDEDVNDEDHVKEPESEPSNETEPRPDNSPLSQTASTMLSLIEPVEESSEIDSNQYTESSPNYNRNSKTPLQKKPFVNPYASTASRSTPRSSRAGRTGATPSSDNGIIKSLERTMPGSPSSTTQINNSAQSVAGNNEASVSSSLGSPALQRKPVTSQFDKYRPAKSSSLRQSLVSSPGSSSENRLLGAGQAKSAGKRSDFSIASTTIIDKPKITPRWSVPDFDDDDDDDEIENGGSNGDDKQLNQPGTMVSPGKPLYPTVGQFSFQKAGSSTPGSVTAPVANQPLQFTNTQQPKPQLFQFGVAAKPEKSSTEGEKISFSNTKNEGTKMFSFSSPSEQPITKPNDSVKPFSFAPVQGAPKLEHKELPKKPLFDFGNKPNGIVGVNGGSNSSEGSSLFGGSKTEAPKFGNNLGTSSIFGLTKPTETSDNNSGDNIEKDKPSFKFNFSSFNNSSKDSIGNTKTDDVGTDTKSKSALFSFETKTGAGGDLSNGNEKKKPMFQFSSFGNNATPAGPSAAPTTTTTTTPATTTTTPPTFSFSGSSTASNNQFTFSNKDTITGAASTTSTTFGTSITGTTTATKDDMTFDFGDVEQVSPPGTPIDEGSLQSLKQNVFIF